MGMATVIGVVRDFNIYSLQHKIEPMVFELPPAEVKEVAALVREEMVGALKLEVPLKVDVAAGKN